MLPSRGLRGATAQRLATSYGLTMMTRTRHFTQRLSRTALCLAVAVAPSIGDAAAPVPPSVEQYQRLEQRMAALKTEALTLQEALLRAGEAAAVASEASTLAIYLTLNFSSEPNAPVHVRQQLAERYWGTTTHPRTLNVRLEVDGETIAHHSYVAQEMRALILGGGHRLFLGNIASGSHDLVAYIEERNTANGDMVTHGAIRFAKGAQPRVIEVAVSLTEEATPPEITFEDPAVVAKDH